MVIYTTNANAHVKWFVEEEIIHRKNTTHQFSLLDIETKSVLTVSILAVLSAILLHIFIKVFIGRSFTIIKKQSITFKSHLIELSRILVGCALFASGVSGTIIAPHIVSSQDDYLLLFVEILTGILLISGRLITFACISLTFLLVSTSLMKNTISLFEYINFFGLAVLFYTTKSLPKNEYQTTDFNDRMDLGLTCYRLTLGVALITLGLTEKILNPDLAISFLSHYPEVNFMKLIGFNFSDHLFVLCCGISECIFGLIYLLGIIPRINTLVLAVFLVSSNTFFAATGFMELAYTELVGHLPLLAGAILLFLLGGGCRLSIVYAKANMAYNQRYRNAPLNYKSVGKVS